jgi:hypothetical protein
MIYEVTLTREEWKTCEVEADCPKEAVRLAKEMAEPDKPSDFRLEAIREVRNENNSSPAPARVPENLEGEQPERRFGMLKQADGSWLLNTEN